MKSILHAFCTVCAVAPLAAAQTPAQPQHRHRETGGQEQFWVSSVGGPRRPNSP